MFLKILVLLGIATGVIALTMVGFIIYFSYTNWKIFKELRDEGFYD